jgi:oligopeptidase B
VDVLNTMLDSSLPLTTIEYEEWGNPTEKNYYDYIKSYSPYDNVEKKSYPHLLVTSGLNDPRVTYWEPAKWVAKLREHKSDSNLLLQHINMLAGHGGASGRYDYLKEIALEYAFVLKVFGIKQ